jgi:hypothetical protein
VAKLAYVALGFTVAARDAEIKLATPETQPAVLV